MKNYAKQMKVYCIIILLIIFSGFFYFLYNFRFEPEYFIYAGSAFIVALTALMGGCIPGLVASIFAIFLYAATYFYTIVRSGIYFDITYMQALWLVSYIFTALIVGKIGDGINFYMGLHKKHPQEMQDLLQDFVFHMISQRRFNQTIDNEIARSRRMQTHFSLAVISIQDIAEVTRVFGEKGIYKVAEKVKLYIRAIIKESDKVTKLNNSTFEILFAELDKNEIISRLSHLEKQLANSYLEHKGTTIKFPIKIFVGAASFPQDGEDVYKLRNKAEKNLTPLT